MVRGHKLSAFEHTEIEYNFTSPSSVIEIEGNMTLSDELVEHLNDRCDRLEELPGDHVTLHVKGHGPIASYWPTPASTDIRLFSKWERLLRRLEQLPLVKATVVEGCCNNAALELLLLADCSIAHPDVRIHLRNELGGPWFGMFVYRLANQIGVVNARRLLLFNKTLDAQRLEQIGLIDRISASADESVALLSCIDLRGADVALLRRLLADAACTSFEDALGSHLAACDRCLRQVRNSASSPQ
jgi:isomerase DpgB